MDKMLATVDLGSNSFRLLIAKIQNDGTITPIDQLKETVRFASYLDENNYLIDDAFQKILPVLARFHDRLKEFNKNQVRVVATNTFRVATNSDKFIDIAKETLGFTIEIISGIEEARLIYIGAAHSIFYSNKKRLVIDIGGGSTEFAIGVGFEPNIMESVAIGCIAFTERYFKDGKISESSFNNAIFAASSRIQSMEHFFVGSTWDEVIGTSGTAKSLYDICIENKLAEHITLEALNKIKKIFIKFKKINEIKLNGLKEDRIPIIVGGTAILIAIFEELKISKMSVADGALREGVMYDLVGRITNHDLRELAVKKLKEKTCIDIVQSNRVASFTLNIYNTIINKSKINSNITKNINQEKLKLLQWAGELYEIGLYISHHDYHKHGAYLLANIDMTGFSKHDQLFIADLIRTHRGNLFKAYTVINNTRKYRTKFLLMIFSLRVAVIFYRNRKEIDREAIINIEKIGKHDIKFIIKNDWLLKNPLTDFSLQEEFLEWKKLDFNITLITI